jgi:hypothetical protein
MDEQGRWYVGFYTPNSHWKKCTGLLNRDQAFRLVNYLNGGASKTDILSELGPDDIEWIEAELLDLRLPNVT